MKRTVLAAGLTLAAVAAHAQSVVVQHGNLVYGNASGATDVLTETAQTGVRCPPDSSLVAFTRVRSGEEGNSSDPNSGA